jgi:hypothetical protein
MAANRRDQPPIGRKIPMVCIHLDSDQECGITSCPLVSHRGQRRARDRSHGSKREKINGKNIYTCGANSTMTAILQQLKPTCVCRAMPCLGDDVRARCASRKRERTGSKPLANREMEEIPSPHTPVPSGSACCRFGQDHGITEYHVGHQRHSSRDAL